MHPAATAICQTGLCTPRHSLYFSSYRSNGLKSVNTLLARQPRYLAAVNPPAQRDQHLFNQIANRIISTRVKPYPGSIACDVAHISTRSRYRLRQLRNNRSARTAVNNANR